MRIEEHGAIASMRNQRAADAALPEKSADGLLVLVVFLNLIRAWPLRILTAYKILFKNK